MSVQLETGYTRLSNELLEAIARTKFSGNELRVLLWMLRNSYGWQKRSAAKVSIGRISQDLKMAKGSVHLALQVLLEANVITKDPWDNWVVNKDYTTWLIEQEAAVQPAERSAHRTKSFSPLNETVQPTERHPFSPLNDHSTDASKKQGENGALKKDVVVKERKERKKEETPGADPSKPYEIKTDHQRVVCCFKVLLGADPENREWDRKGFPQWSRAARDLLAAFNGNANEAIDFAGIFVGNMDAAGRSWTPATIAKHAELQKPRREAARREEEAARANREENENAPQF